MWPVNGLVASSQNKIYYYKEKGLKLAKKPFITFISLKYLVYAIQPGAIQTNTEEKV